jgi:multidrug resistance efflux pump
MFPSKMRCVTLFVLVGFLAGCASILFLRVDAQEAAKPEGNDAKLKALLEERLATTQKAANLARQQARNLTGTINDVLTATRLAHEAAIELCMTDQERKAVLDSFLVAATDNEMLATELAKVAQGRGTEMLLAKAERLRVEIALERAKTKKEARKEAPQAGDAKKALTLPGYVQASESVRLHSRVPGILKNLPVDIGERVKRGQVLAVLDVPDLEAQVRLDQARVELALARLLQSKSRLEGTAGEYDVGKVEIAKAEAAAKQAVAETRFREVDHKRVKQLYDSNAVDKSLLDRAESHHQAAVSAEAAALAAIELAKLKLRAGANKIEQAKADVLASEADVEAAKAVLDIARVKLSFATITAPFDGFITRRSCNVGDFIGSADDARTREPLLTVDRIDLMRVVVDVPERSARWIEKGTKAEIEIEALPGKKWSAKAARFAGSLDAKERVMRVEFDLPNPNEEIFSGMSCTVTILLEKQ